MPQVAKLARPRTHLNTEVLTSCQPQSPSSKSQVKGVPSTSEPRRYPEDGQTGCQGRAGSTPGTSTHLGDLHPCACSPITALPQVQGW